MMRYVLATVALIVSLFAAHVVLTPCATEDSYMCTWNADSAGNGSGRSFTTIGFESAHIVILH